MLHVNLLGAHAARATTLAQQASRRRKALDAVVTARETARMADHERAEQAKALVSPELVEQAERERSVRSMLGPGPSPADLKYRARKDEHSPLLAPAKLTKDTGRGAPEKTFAGALKLGPVYSPAPHDTRKIDSGREYGAGRAISGPNKARCYAPGQHGKGLRSGGSVFATKAGTGSVAYQSQVRMMSRWQGALATASAPRLAEPSRPRETRQPLPPSVTAWRPLTVDGRKRRR